jgi:hypothetical protein
LEEEAAKAKELELAALENREPNDEDDGEWVT